MPISPRVAGADATQRQAFVAAGRNDRLSFATLGDDDVEAIAATLSGHAFERLVWIASRPDTPTLTEEAIIEHQQRGIVQVMRLARALERLETRETAAPARRDLQWDLVTVNALPATAGSPLEPTHAGLQGLTGSMAEVYPG